MKSRDRMTGFFSGRRWPRPHILRLKSGIAKKPYGNAAADAPLPKRYRCGA